MFHVLKTIKVKFKVYVLSVVIVFQGYGNGSLLHGLQQFSSGHSELLAGAGEL